jgi:hypothetical protein
MIGLDIGQADCARSCQDAEDAWLPVLAALQNLVNRG